MKLYIKNMSSGNCKEIIKNELEAMGIRCKSINLGEVDITGTLSEQQRSDFRVAISKHGFELLEDKKNVLVEKIKSIIIEMIHYSNQPLKVNFSHYLSQRLNYNYTYLSNQFSESQGITIEKMIINHKIEKVKELIAYNELNLTEIAYKMNYSSVAHLSSQFKKVTGVSPSRYRGNKDHHRVGLEKVIVNPAAA